MTTPSNTPEPRAGDTSPLAQPAGAAQGAPAAPGVQSSPQPPQFAPPGGQPFAPVPRTPRMPWVNPARRGHVVAVAVVGALVFGGAGVLVGHAATRHGDRDVGVVRFRHLPGQGGPGFGRGPYPGRPLPSATVVPTPAPSSTATG